MPWPVHPTGFFGARGDQDTYRIERSLRFNSADSAYLNRTPASAGNRKTWTWSGWVKRSNLGTAQVFYSASETGSSSQLFFDTSDRINIFASAASINVVSTPRYRDVSSWYHIVVSLDTTQATALDRVKLYVNGIQVTAFEGSTYYPSQNAEPNINNTVIHALGAQAASGSITAGTYLSSYLTEINFIDGQALTPSSFGETDAITGRWKAKAYSGTYGTNGFYLKFADNSGTTATTLGKDSSGNGNNWTPNNFSVTAGAGNDSLVDSPTNYGADTKLGGEVRGNYCTLSGIDFSAGASGFSLTNGNLQYSKSGDIGNSRVRGTVFVGSGKYYWECNITSVGGAALAVGIATTQYRIGTTNDTPVRAYLSGGNKLSGATGTAYGSSWTANDVIGVALDMDAGSIVFYKNNSSQGTAFTDLAGSSWTPWIQGEGVLDCNFGHRPFAYTAPSGYKALCTTNLPQPIIQKPSKYMDVVAYTGTGASNSISSLGFSPDLVWIKNRGTTTSHAIYDTTRGSQNQLSSDTTGDAVTSSSGLTAFGANGFTIGTSSLVNTSGTQYVAWSWDEAPIAGMDIVSYTGNGANRTIAHTLGVAPKMLVVKAITTDGADQGWPVWHTSISNTTYLQLNSTSATATGTDYWNSASPTSSVFSFGTNAAVNANNDTYIAYLFAEVEGFSKFGSYTGNGSADGPFVWCGFRPRWVMAKSATGAYNWHLYDAVRNTANVCDSDLLPNLSSAEVTASPFIDILSNGFKVRASDIGFNGSGATFIFAAFAESPFKYARAR